MIVHKEKIILFGASKQGMAAYEDLAKDYQVVAYCDNDSSKWGTSCMECKVIPPGELCRYGSIPIVITSFSYREIGRQLEAMGFRDVKVYMQAKSLSDTGKSYVSYELLDIPFDGIFSKVNIDMGTALEVANDFEKNYNLEALRRKKVLFVAYAFPPRGGSGVQRGVKFVKYLREYGYEPVVLTVGKTMYGEDDIDAHMLREIPEDVSVIRIDDSLLLPEQLTQQEQQEILNLYYGVVQSESWIRKYIDVIENKVNDMPSQLIPDMHIYWVNQVLRQICSKINLSDIDIIFTTGSYYSAYFLGYYIKQKYHIPWIMDDRDAWTANDYYSEVVNFKEKKGTFALEVELNRKLLYNADWLVVVAKQIQYDYMDKFAFPENRSSVITNGFDEEDFKAIQCNMNREKFLVCYNGWLHIDRDPVVVLQVLNELIDAQYMDASEVEWVFNGIVILQKKEQLESLDKHHILKFNGYQEHIESLQIASQAAVLVLFGGIGEGSKMGYTGKLFEYLRLQIPILGISTSGGVFDEVFEQTQCGKNFEYEDTKGMKGYLLGLYQMWKNGEFANKARKQEIMKYERKILTKQLADVFDEVLCNQGKY